MEQTLNCIVAAFINEIQVANLIASRNTFEVNKAFENILGENSQLNLKITDVNITLPIAIQSIDKSNDNNLQQVIEELLVGLEEKKSKKILEIIFHAKENLLNIPSNNLDFESFLLMIRSFKISLTQLEKDKLKLNFAKKITWENKSKTHMKVLFTNEELQNITPNNITTLNFKITVA